MIRSTCYISICRKECRTRSVMLNLAVIMFCFYWCVNSLGIMFLMSSFPYFRCYSSSISCSRWKSVSKRIQAFQTRGCCIGFYTLTLLHHNRISHLENRKGNWQCNKLPCQSCAVPTTCHSLHFTVFSYAKLSCNCTSLWELPPVGTLRSPVMKLPPPPPALLECWHRTLSSDVQ